MSPEQALGEKVVAFMDPAVVRRASSSPPDPQAVSIARAIPKSGLMEAYQPRGDLHFQMHLKRDPGLKWLKGRWGRNLLLPDPP